MLPMPPAGDAPGPYTFFLTLIDWYQMVSAFEINAAKPRPLNQEDLSRSFWKGDDVIASSPSDEAYCLLSVRTNERVYFSYCTSEIKQTPTLQKNR